MEILFFLLFILVILGSISVHEYFHAKAADILGDPTPRLAGRLTVNPIAHIDPIGLLMLVLIRIGWAKPVPINPYNFKNPNQGMMIVGLAGPVANFLLAWILAVILRTAPGLNSFWAYLLSNAIFVNLALMVFNLLPIPPLDGSRIFTQFLPYEWQYNLERYGFLILVLILIFPPTQALLFMLIRFFYNLIV